MSDRSQFLAEIDKITGSSVLHGSESLCKLLRYLSKHRLEKPGVHLKEYQIATEVFGRPADFDPQADSTIRVQAGRLRGKLSDYYSSEGAEDPIVVELPRGSYVLQFHHRSHGNGKGHGAADYEPERAAAAAKNRAGASGIAIGGLSVLLIAALMAIVNSWSKKTDTSLASGEPPPPAVFVTFWKPFVSAPEEPWVIFSNGAFVGRPETGMRYFNPARDVRSPVILDHYTGVGEVLAVHNLDRVFDRLHRQIRVKRGSLFSLDDAKNNNLIFVGSPAENLTLRDIPGTEEFVFQRLDSGARKGDLAIANLHPQAGEPAFFLASPSNTPLNEDYSVIALVKGLDPTRSVLILAGTTTMGTQAAVEFTCDQNSLRELLQRLNATETSGVKPFEAVLRVKVTRGVPVETSIVALRTSQ